MILSAETLAFRLSTGGGVAVGVSVGTGVKVSAAGKVAVDVAVSVTETGSGVGEEAGVQAVNKTMRQVRVKVRGILFPI